MASKEYRSLKNKYTLFSWSTPVGYDFEEVENVIKEYKSTISDINEVIQKKDNIIDILKAENNRLVSEITNAQLQMESITAPSLSVDQSMEVLNDFMGVETQEPEVVMPQPSVSAPRQVVPRQSIPTHKPQQQQRPHRPPNNNQDGGWGGMPIIE